ncbi:MAG: metallophosphoesterase [Pseudomonadota bacterium]
MLNFSHRHVCRLVATLGLLGSIVLTPANADDTKIIPHVELGNGPVPWTSLEALDAEADFHFVVITDRTGGERKGPWADAMDKINLMRPAFVVSVGDLIQGGTGDKEQLDFEWDELTGLVEVLKPPFFYVAGNHDYSNVVMADEWAERFGPSYYAFRYKDTLFVTLNSSLFGTSDAQPDEWIAAHEAQAQWFADTLAENEGVRWTYVFLHHPFWREFWWRRVYGENWEGAGYDPESRYGGGTESWKAVEELLDTRDYTVFAGHTHTYEYEADEDSEHVHERISLATTGGGSTIREGDSNDRATVLRGPQFAEFDHFVWVTMTEDGPVIANMLLDGILDKDFDHAFKGSP